MDALSSSDVCLFGPFRFDRRGGVLLRCDDDGRYLPVSIGSRALAVLGALTARPGDLVSRDEIMRAAWPGTVVEEGNLAVQISALRRILDAGSEGASCIQTVSGRGYRFVPRVTRHEEKSEASASEDAPSPPGVVAEAAAPLFCWRSLPPASSGRCTTRPRRVPPPTRRRTGANRSSCCHARTAAATPRRTALPPASAAT